MTWIQTYTGVKFDVLNPRVEDVDVLDIARGLALTCRYNGQTAHGYYSVAEHSVLVSRHVNPEYAREALMHDAAEAYVGDVVRPLKRLPEMRGYVEVEARIERVIAEKFGLRTDPATIAAWKTIDDRILVDEIGALMRDPVMQLQRHQGKQSVGAEVMCYSPERAQLLFLARFGELFPEYVDADRLKVSW
jgi:hypothetical protein